MKLYKLTDENDQTFGGCQWGENITHTAPGKGELCSDGWIHATTDPLLAIFLNPIHGNYDLKTAHLWEGEGKVGKEDYGLKIGCTSFTTLRRIPLLEVTLEQTICFGVLASLEVYHEPGFVFWANNWLSGKDRSARAAKAAEAAASTVATAVEAAEAGAWAAFSARAGAWAGAWAAWSARAAAWAGATGPDLIALARKAVGG